MNFFLFFLSFFFQVNIFFEFFFWLLPCYFAAIYVWTRKFDINQRNEKSGLRCTPIYLPKIPTNSILKNWVNRSIDRSIDIMFVFVTVYKCRSAEDNILINKQTNQSWYLTNYDDKNIKRNKKSNQSINLIQIIIKK